MKIRYSPCPLLTGREIPAQQYWLDGELWNGGIRLGTVQRDGKVLNRWRSVQPNGSYEEREAEGDRPPGLYEQIVPADDLNVLIVKPATTFKIPFIVTAL